MPFRCPHCGDQFCSIHRLPENHGCPGLERAQAQRQAAISPTPPRASYEYSVTFGQSRGAKGRVYLSPKEAKHLSVAALLVLGIGFSVALYGDYFTWFGWTWTIASVFAVVLAASFLVHEMAHKVTAQRRGLWAEFRLTTWGAVLTLISVVSPFKLIAPGAVMISGPARRDELGRISIVGPFVNAVLCALFLGFTLVPSPYFSLFALIALVNATIAVFNLLPFGILDGFKIYRWNRKIWGLAFAAAFALAVPSYVIAWSYI